VFEVDQVVAGNHSDGERAVDTDACRKRIAESVDVDPVADCLDIERRDSAGVRLSGEFRDERYRSRFFIDLPVVSVWTFVSTAASPSPPYSVSPVLGACFHCARSARKRRPMSAVPTVRSSRRRESKSSLVRRVGISFLNPDQKLPHFSYSECNVTKPDTPV
jgi:hypothetical protein